MQTKAGAQKAKATLLAKDPDYFKKLGQKGGKATSGYAFGHGKVDPAEAGAKGGIARSKALRALQNVLDGNGDEKL